ncbi:tripartite tricarboxylate transporter TctB family protein [Caldibacillus lycopersici]|uniref:Tripartite tricarboxylate transporter TctB family protein n=1 Tax=Perspicuibacillus lycopersici TaxID=1325689 RepID=A0AAE3LU12_9BACI|nr:tripartite tricarboxylate transporter TctB family protein [Perspicuibacillus lycopersici]MCU9614923.1 tripartite tricarboxylate transporter TctB family protein [Perspicuibacillus lycopersici]
MNKTFDRYAGIVFLAIGAFFIIESHRISANAYGSSVGPNVFPFGLGILLGLLSIRLIYETFKYQQTENQKEKLDYKRFAIILVASVLYALLLEDAGYVVTTFLFLLIGFQTMQRGKIFVTLIISLSFSVGVFLLFDKLLNVPLPSSASWLGIL